ncbi:MAG: hypothetical protein ABR591_03605 [Candidatus Velthaea sp.]
MKQRPRPVPRRGRFSGQVWLKAFIWVFLAIFLFGSLGVALVVTR